MSKEDKLRRRLARQNQQSGTFQITAANMQFSGPLPHPDILVKYNDAKPGAADRIIAMAEKQAAHRQGIEKQVITANCQNAKRGPIYGFVICMTAIAGGVYLIQLGKGAEGLVAIISALASLAFVFVYGRTKQKQELNQKLEGLSKT
ncbi:MAG: DUF2335 domain-containing protein [Candidatus Acidiferrales bacterium]